MGICNTSFSESKTRSKSCPDEELNQIIDEINFQSKRIESLLSNQGLSKIKAHKKRISELPKTEIVTENILLKLKVKEFKEWRNRAISKHLSKLDISLQRQRLIQSFCVWKEKVFKPFDIENSMIVYATSMIKDSYSKLLEDNLLMENFPACLSEKPMQKHSLFELFDSLFDQYHEEINKINIEAQAYPSFPEFSMKFMNAQIGGVLKKLKKIYAKGDPYGVLLCRFLMIFHPRPIPPYFSMYLVNLRQIFNRLAGNPFQKFNKDVSLEKVFNLVYFLIENDSITRNNIINKLKPPGISLERYLLLRINFRLNRLKYTPQSYFYMISNNYKVSEQVLISSIKNSLGIEASNCLILSVFQARKGYIDMEYFINILVSHYQDDVDTDFLVSMTEFFTILLNEYDNMLLRSTLFLCSWYDSLDRKPNSPERFAELMYDIDINIDYLTAFTRFHEMHEEFPEGISCESFCWVILKYHIGGFGIRDFNCNNFCSQVFSDSDNDDVDSDSLISSRDSSNGFK